MNQRVSTLPTSVSRSSFFHLAAFSTGKTAAGAKTDKHCLPDDRSYLRKIVPMPDQLFFSARLSMAHIAQEEMTTSHRLRISQDGDRFSN